MPAVVALWFTVAVTLANLVARDAPDVALAWWPPSAAGRASEAAQLLQRSQSADTLQRARELSLTALAREPLQVTALRTLSLVASLSGDDRRGDHLIRVAESLSRRDLPTELVLIEREVARNNIGAALLHYDRALRTSPSSEELLLPILVRAAAEPQIGGPLASLVRERPPWWLAYTQRLIAEGNSAPALSRQLVELQLNGDESGEASLIVSGMNRLVALGDFSAAYSVYRQAKHGRADADGLIRNGEFNSNNGLPPFDWMLVDDEGLSAVRNPRDGAPNDYALFLTAQPGRGGEFARQLLVLPSGRYELTFIAGDVGADPDGRPAVALVCAVGATPIAEVLVPPSPARGQRVARQFAIPGNCPAQWLLIRSGSSANQEQASASWLDSFSLNRL